MLALAIQNSFIQATAIILIVVAIEAVWRISAKYDPLTLFKLLAIRLDSKVNHAEHGRLQNMIAGYLGFSCLVLPLLLIIYLTLEIVQYRWFFEALILFIALSSSDKSVQYRRVHKYLSKQNKTMARECLSSLVLRKTTTLSPLGCAKAAMESAALRFYYQFASIVFWFFLVGPIFALFVRLVFEFQQAWNTRHYRYRFFGAPLARLNHALQWLPCILHCLLFSILYRPTKVLKHWFLNMFEGTRDLILACTAFSIPCELGGPVIYSNQKIRLKRHAESVEVKLAHMKVMHKHLQFLKIVLVCFYTLASFAVYTLSIKYA